MRCLDRTVSENVLMIQDRNDDPDSTAVSADASTSEHNCIVNSVINTNSTNVSYANAFVISTFNDT